MTKEVAKTFLVRALRQLEQVHGKDEALFRMAIAATATFDNWRWKFSILSHYSRRREARAWHDVMGWTLPPWLVLRGRA